MKIAIFGATGYIGGAILEKLLASGHGVQALVRNESKLGDPRKNVTVIQGDLSNAAKISETLTGVDAVIWAVGATKNKGDQAPVYAAAMNTVFETMRKYKRKRLLVLAGAALITPAEIPNFNRKFMLFMTKLFAPKVVETSKQVFDLLLQNKDLHWTVVRPAYIPKGNPSGNVRSDANHMQGMRIDVADLALFFEQQLTDESYIHEAPFLASG
jgi:putative NADH-flavin reductase